MKMLQVQTATTTLCNPSCLRQSIVVLCCVLVGASVASSGQAASASAPNLMTLPFVRCGVDVRTVSASSQPKMFLQAIDEALKAMDNVHADAAAIQGWNADVMHRLQADIAQYVLAPDKTKAMSAQFNDIVRSERKGALRPEFLQQLDNARARVCNAAVQAMYVLVYWQQREWIERLQRERREALAAVGKQLGESAEEIAAVVEFEQLAAQGNFEMAARRAANVRVRATEISRAAFAAAGVVHTPTETITMKPRSIPCPPATTTSSSSEPKVISIPPVPDYYPASSVRRGEEGNVLVNVRVDERGCAVQAGVVLGSAFDSIDDAALRLVFAGRYRPAQVDGRPVARDLGLVVKMAIN